MSTNNKYKFLAALAFCFIAVVGCEAPDQELFDEIPRDQGLATTDPDALKVFAASAYKPIIGTWGGHNSLWSMHENSSDESVITVKGGDWLDGNQWTRMHTHNFLPSEESIANGWNYCYTAIATINNLLTSFGSNPQLRAELESLRAMIYLWLIDAYGNVPVVTDETTDVTPNTVPRAEVYAFIESSILDNIDLLPKSKTYATMNYYAAQAVLAKLFLNATQYKGSPEWAKCADACTEIIESGLYSLSANMLDNFRANNAG